MGRATAKIWHLRALSVHFIGFQIPKFCILSEFSSSSMEIPAIPVGYLYDTSSLFTGILYTPSVLVMSRGAATFCPSLSVSFFFILETLV